MNKPIRLLYLEDDELERRSFCQTVSEKGLPYELTAVGTLAEARAALAKSRFDLIVADYHLPDGHATDLFDEVKDVPFILLTGTLEEQMALRTLERGADDYLAKDPDGQHLQALPFTVEKVLHRKRIYDVEQRLTRELRQSEERYRLLVEGMSEHAVMLIDPAGHIVSWNVGAEQVFGWTKENIAGQRIDLLYTPEDQAAGVPARELTQAREFGRSGGDRWLLRKDGTRFYAAGTTACIRDETGEVRSYVKVAYDATRQKLAERVLRESEQLLASQVPPAHGKDGLLLRLRQSLLVGSRSLSSRYGMAIAITVGSLLALELLSPPFGRTVPPLVLLVLAITAAAWWGGIGPGLVATAVSTIVGWWAFVPPYHSFAVNNPSELVRYLVVAFCGIVISFLAGVSRRAVGRQRTAIARLATEVDERRKIEATMREQAQVVDLSYDALLAWPLDGTIRYWSSGAERLYGFSRAEALGRLPDDLLKTQVDGGPTTILTALKRDKYWSGELRHHARDGREVLVESRMVLVPGQDGDSAPVVIESNRDITARKRAEQSLLESEQWLALAARGAHVGMFDWNVETGERRWTPEYEAILGYVPSLTITTHPFHYWADRVHPDDLPWVVKEARQSVADGTLYESQYRVVWPDGSVHWIEARGMPALDVSGHRTRLMGAVTDVTARKTAEDELRVARDSSEKAKAEAELANHAKDHFLAVLSHELRTPLTPVVLGISMLQEKPNLDPAMRETLAMVHSHVEMEAQLIDDLLDVTRIARGKIELQKLPVDLCSVIQRAVDVCRPDIDARGLRFDVDLGLTAPYWVEADPGRLQQVFWNLLENAVKFTPRGGSIGIHCRPDAEFVIVEVNDTGIGIEPEALTRVFNAFEQAERSITRQFGGLGLGLAISKALVEMHGGTIEAHSEGRDKGSTFTVRLPLAAPAGQKELPSTALPPEHAVRPLQILLVEDHGITAQIVGLVLASDGHTVKMAGDVATALELASTNRYDLLLSDLGLPDATGYDLLRRLRQRGHKFPAIALSGYGQEEDIRRSHEAGFAAHLKKPVSHEALSQAIAAATGEQTGTATIAPRAGPETPPRVESPVFDPRAALQRCLGSPDLLAQMIQFFFKDLDELLPQIHSALQRGDLAEVARLSHRFKGTITHLAAERAREAAREMERIGISGTPQPNAEESLATLDRECQVLKAALLDHQAAPVA
ncbi:MAG: PAS domain S-box protein [Planctomycetaceae bacterium]|nr:PAS domain S-box protein [Planctomycetaceae bacterium]